jgi:hypothetical protein
LYKIKKTLQRRLLGLFTGRVVKYFVEMRELAICRLIIKNCRFATGAHKKFADMQMWNEPKNLRIYGPKNNICLPSSAQLLSVCLVSVYMDFHVYSCLLPSATVYVLSVHLGCYLLMCPSSPFTCHFIIKMPVLLLLFFCFY